MAKKKKSRLRRWAKRVGIGFLVLVLAALISPFLFTTTLVRWALAHSAYAKFSPAISKASLGPMGTLTLQDVELFEAGPFSDALLLSARQAQIRFSWWKILGMTISSADIDGLIIHVRPGRTYPVTLLTLAYPPGMDGVAPELQAAKAPAAPGGGGGNPFWFDRLHATGTVKLHPFTNFQLSGRDLPLTLDVAMHGARHDPHRDLTLALGEPATARTAAATRTTTSTAPTRRPLSEVGLAMTASVRMIPLENGRMQIAIDHGEAWNLAAGITPELLRQLLPILGSTSGETQFEMDRVSISGLVDQLPSGSGLMFAGQIEAHDVSLAAAAGTAGTFGVDQFSLSARVETPLSGGHLSDVSIHDATTGFASLDVNPLHAGRTQAAWSLEKGVLDVVTLQGSALDGTITGNVRVNLLDLTQAQGKLTLEHVDPKQLLAMWPGDWQEHAGFSAQGHVSGQMEIKPGAGGLEGTLGLTPGNDLGVAFSGLMVSAGAWNANPKQTFQIEAGVTAARQGDQWELGLPRVAVSTLLVHGEAEALRKKWPALPADIKGPVELTIGTITGDGQTGSAGGEKRVLGHVQLAEVALHAPQSKDYPVTAEHLAATGTWSVPLAAAGAAAWEMEAGNMTAATLQLGQLQANDMRMDWTLQQGTWHVTGAQLTAFGAQVNGEVVYHISNGVLESSRINVQHLDQHQLLATMDPEKVDAEGPVSGLIELWNTLDPKTHRGGPLQWKGNLKADGPGRLLIKNDQVAQDLAAQLNKVNVGMLPPNFGDILKEQLKNYPYATGQVELTTVGNEPVLVLNYHRLPLKEGDPGYAVPQEIGGQKVLANYAIQLTGVSVHVHNTIEELLEMLARTQRSLLPGVPGQ